MLFLFTNQFFFVNALTSTSHLMELDLRFYCIHLHKNLSHAILNPMNQHRIHLNFLSHLRPLNRPHYHFHNWNSFCFFVIYHHQNKPSQMSCEAKYVSLAQSFEMQECKNFKLYGFFTTLTQNSIQFSPWPFILSWGRWVIQGLSHLFRYQIHHSQLLFILNPHHQKKSSVSMIMAY